MSLAPGTRLGPYEIVSALGAGGMGEVYRAKDTNLNRDVAIKILPESFALDADRVARFKREAQVLASLNHPNIAQIHGFEETTSGVVSEKRHPMSFLVMELVEGEDLSAIIARGPIAIADALPVAKQIAEALEAAHEQGIVHRDLKPANIKVRTDGTVKVLDFGLAKAMDPTDPSGANAMNSPTMTARATQMGMIIGTAAYMSPEQAKGRAVDKRADIWAFGVVLFEMLTGQRAFQGEDISETLASVLKDSVDLNLLPASTTFTIRRLLQRCLERDPRKRLRDIGDARHVLEGGDDALLSGTNSGSMSASGGTAAVRRSPRSTALFAAIVVVALAAGAAGLFSGRWIWSAGSDTTDAPLARAVMLAPAGVTSVERPVMAADGSFLVFVGFSGNTQQLYLRRLDEIEPRPIEHTVGGDRPFLSFDQKWIGFTRANRLEKVSVAGGEAVPIAELSTSNPGSAWGPDNTILLTRNWYGGISAVSSSGGAIRTVTTPDAAKGEKGHWFPQFLPDGRHVLFTIWKAAGSLNDAEIAVLDVSSGTYKVIMSGAHGSYVAPGFLVFYRAGAYHAVRFDLDSHTPSGDSVTVLTDDRGISPDGSNPSFSVTPNGVAAYVPGQYFATSTLTWIAEGGTAEPLTFTARGFVDAAIAPQGHRIAAGVVEGGRYVVRLLDLDRQTDQVLELPGSNWNAKWHPDGRRIAVRALREGNFDIYAKDITTSAPPIRLLSKPGDESPMAWLSEKKLLISQELGDGIYRTKLLDLDAPDNPKVLAGYNPDSLSVSPDGVWMAMAEPHTGRAEVYVRRIEGDGLLEPVTAKGGTSPVWLSKSRELLYMRGQDIMAASWREEAGRFRMDRERVWAHLPSNVPLGILDAAPDGRVLAAVPVDGTRAPQVRIILNWQQEIARKLAGK